MTKTEAVVNAARGVADRMSELLETGVPDHEPTPEAARLYAAEYELLAAVRELDA